jgi:Methyl-accepting chemotaxis protein
MKPDTAKNSDIQKRIEFIGLVGKSRETLQSLQPLVAQSIEGALDVFYGKIAATPEAAAFFSSADHVNMAKGRQAKHWSIIASGRFDKDYVDGVTAIGKTHARIGLEPRLYIAGYALILEQLVHSVVARRRGGILGRGKGEDLAAEVSVIIKAALLDMDYAISVYLDELDNRRKEAEAARLEAETAQKIALDQLAGVLASLSRGDLEARLPEGLPGEFAGMAHHYNEAVEGLNASILAVRTAAEQILAFSREIATSTEQLSSRTEQQAASVEESSAALHELSESVSGTAAGAQKAATVTSDALSVAQSSGEIVQDAVTAMGAIEKSSAEISKIIGVIDEIAFQTNLLALNAGVEAARAGEAGRGFAVVAQEVRELAQRSANAAKEIKSIIAESTKQVRTGVDLVNQSGNSLNDIIGRVEELNGIISGIAAATGEQSSGLGEISAAINEMDTITQQNATMVDETSTRIGKLSGEVERLTESLHGFRIRGGDGSHIPGRAYDYGMVKRSSAA